MLSMISINQGSYPLCYHLLVPCQRIAKSHTHPYIPPHQHQIVIRLFYHILLFIVILLTTTFGYLDINHMSSNNIDHFSRCNKCIIVTLDLLVIHNYHILITIIRCITIYIVGRVITWIFWWRVEEINHYCTISFR